LLTKTLVIETLALLILAPWVVLQQLGLFLSIASVDKEPRQVTHIKGSCFYIAEVCLLNNSSCLAEALSVTKYVTVIGVKNFSRFARLIATMYLKGKRQFKPKGPIG
jgi:hypothetical protein